MGADVRLHDRYSRSRTCRPSPASATSWETSADGLTWTFKIRDGVTWSDGEQLTARDIAFTYNRILDGGPEGRLGLLPDLGQDGRGPGRHPRGAEAGEAERGAAVAAHPDRPRARLVGRQREAGQELRRRADRGRAGGRLRTVPLVEGHRRRLDVPLRGEPGLLAGRAAHRRGRLPGLQERGPDGPGPASRARSTSPTTSLPAPGQGARGQSTGSPRSTATPRASTRSRSTPARSTLKTGKPIGDANPAAAGPEVPPRSGLRDRPRPDHRRASTRAQGLPGTRSSRRRTRAAMGATDGPGLQLRPRQGRPSCSTRPATRSGADG